MNIVNIILILSSIVSFILALFVFLNNRKNKINISFSLFTVCVAMWVLANYMIDNVGTYNGALIWSRITVYVHSFLPAFFLYFTLVFPCCFKRIRGKKLLLLFIPGCIFFILAGTNLVVESVDISTFPVSLNYGPLYPALSIYIVIYLLPVFIIPIIKYRKLKQEEKSQLKFFFIGSILMTGTAVFTNLILPIFNFTKDFTRIGPVVSMVFIIFTSYAIIKHKLFSVKIIATETLAFFIFIVILIDTINSGDIKELLLNLGLLIIMATAGILLIKSVLREVKISEENQKLVKSLQEANKHLTEIDQAKTEFVSVASHQLRTPLSVIKSILSMMIGGDFGKFTDVQKQYLEKSFKHSERLNKLIEILLNVTRIEQGRIELKLEPIQIEDFTKNILKDYKETAEEKGLKIYFENLKYLLPKVMLDQDQVKEVLTNLIDNAIKYTSKGKIKISAESDNHNIIVKVADTGIGFLASESDEIFQRFSRSKRSRQIYSKGAGLGLYVARKIVEAHKGKIWAESKGANKGSIFRFSLPLK